MDVLLPPLEAGEVHGGHRYHGNGRYGPATSALRRMTGLAKGIAAARTDELIFHDGHRSVPIAVQGRSIG